MELHRTTLDDKTMKKFLLRIKVICDLLNGVEDPISHQKHVDVILEGLLMEYDPIIVVIERKFESPPIAKVEVLLLVHRSRILKS